jgi:signal transduction histidine kinase
MQTQPFTGFAPTPMDSTGRIQADTSVFAGLPHLRDFLDSVPTMAVVLNPNRQIVWANRALMAFTGLPESEIYGHRPGDVMQCLHAGQGESGCGTTEFCRTCGAAKAIHAAQHGQSGVEECRILRDVQSGPLDLRVWTTPLNLDGRAFTLFAVLDISHEKRRRILERIFFHDVLNTAGGLQGYIELLRESAREEVPEIAGRVDAIARRLVDEIRAQRELSAAESGELKLDPGPVSATGFVNEVAVVYRGQAIGQAKTIRVETDPQDVVLITDRALLSRVVGNMIKNALEASEKGQTMTVGWMDGSSGPSSDGAELAPPPRSARRQAGAVEFYVHNEGVMPRDVQLQIFQRSFTTKGVGHGLGTYSMRLLGERYLGGQVGFESTDEHGTRFWLTLPVQ